METINLILQKEAVIVYYNYFLRQFSSNIFQNKYWKATVEVITTRTHYFTEVVMLPY